MQTDRVIVEMWPVETEASDDASIRRAETPRQRTIGVETAPGTARHRAAAIELETGDSRRVPLIPRYSRWSFSVGVQNRTRNRTRQLVDTDASGAVSWLARI